MPRTYVMSKRSVTFKIEQERKRSSDNCAGPHLTLGWALWKTLTPASEFG